MIAHNLTQLFRSTESNVTASPITTSKPIHEMDVSNSDDDLSGSSLASSSLFYMYSFSSSGPPSKYSSKKY